MKRAATIAIAAVVGLHCGGYVEPPIAGDEPALRSEPTSDDEHAASVPTVEGDEGEAPAFAPMFVNRTSGIASRARGESGETYVTGVFTGRIPAGSGVLESRGGNDVFLARVEESGDVAWALAVGSEGEESGPEVTFREGKVRLFAFTTGQVDCGNGPIGTTWTSPMFFLCTFSPRGELISGGIFPTGSP